MKLVEIYGIFILLFSYFVYIKKRERVQNSSVGRYLLSDTHQLYNDIWNKSHEKGHEHWMYEDSTTNCKRTVLRWVGKVEIRFHQGEKKIISENHNWEESQTHVSLTWETRAQAPYQPSQPWDPAQEK